jgi:hypothetical protein
MVSIPTSPPRDSPSERSLQRGYETTHISIAVLLAVVIGLAIGGVGVCLGVWWLQKDDLRAAARDDRPMSFVHVAPDRGGTPPLQPDGPAHDTTPPQDLAAMHAGEDAVFARLGWRDVRTGSISVPADICAEVIRRSTPVARAAP